jgi:glucokinase
VNTYTIGADLGGTKLAAALVAADGTVVREAWIPHRIDGPEALLEAFDLMIGALGAGQLVVERRIAAVGLSIAAWLDAARSTVRIGANLGLADIALPALLAPRFGGVPVRLVNDGDATLWGEARLGAARGSDVALLFTLGTDVGGAVVAGGRLLTGASGLGGELGHLFVEGTLQCVCGSTGCLATIASGRALAVAAQQLRDSGESPALSSRSDQALTARELGQAAADGDTASIAVVDHAAWGIAAVVTTLIPALDPSIIVLGGSVMDGVGDLLLTGVRKHLASRDFLTHLRPLPDVVRAQLGSRAAVLGAAAFAQSN